jgi:hypothetical protein
MIDPRKEQKIRRFLADTEMVESIKDVFLTVYLRKQKDEGVHELAAHSLAIYLMTDAFNELEKYRVVEQPRQSLGTQPGV